MMSRWGIETVPFLIAAVKGILFREVGGKTMKRIMSLVLILACLLWLTVPAAGAGTDLQTLVNGLE